MKYLNCSRAWCCCWAALNLLEQVEDGKIGLSRGMSPKLEVVGSWILFIIMKCLRVVNLVVIKRWSKGCYHHTMPYEYWWRVCDEWVLKPIGSGCRVVRWMNESWSRMVQVIEQSLERERTWTYINIIEQFFRTWTWTYININIRSEAALRPVWRWEVYFFVVQCRISSATKTSVNGPTRLNFRSSNSSNVAQITNYKLQVTS